MPVNDETSDVGDTSMVEVSIADSDDGFAAEPLEVCLTPDRMHLAILLRHEALDLPRASLVALIQRRCVRLGAPHALPDAESYLRLCSPGVWVTVASGTPPIPPRDGFVELFLPLSLYVDDDLGVRHRHAVRAGTPLARLHKVAPGVPGRDLCGNVIEVDRSPREACLPQGEQTTIDADGITLLAACDGEVILRDMLVHILPTRVIDGDAITVDRPLRCDGDAFVMGSIGPGRCLEAHGHVHVEGHVTEATITSIRGSVTIHGSVTGERNRPSIVRAALDVTCGATLNAMLHADESVHLLQRARHSVITAAHDIHLCDSIAASLFNVETHVGGGIIPSVMRPDLTTLRPTERRHMRVPTDLLGEIALYRQPPLDFVSFAIEDMSACGARLKQHRASDGRMPELGSLVQIKFTLPGEDEQVLALGRVARIIDHATIAVDYLDMPDGHEERLSAFCRRLLVDHLGASDASSADRQQSI